MSRGKHPWSRWQLCALLSGSDLRFIEGSLLSALVRVSTLC